MMWRIPAQPLCGGGAKRDTPGVRRFEAAHEALPVAQNAAKKSWRRKDSDTSKKHEDTIINKVNRRQLRGRVLPWYNDLLLTEKRCFAIERERRQK